MLGPGSSRSVVTFALALLLALGTVAPTHARTAPVVIASPSQAPSEQASRQLSLKSRQEVFERVWKDIADHYYDRSFNGVDWNEVRARYKPLVDAAKDDREFYALMSQMTGELHDAHTRFNSPEQWRNIKKQQGVGSGLSLDEIDGKIGVTAIRADSNAAHLGIQPGMGVLTVEGKAV